MSTILQILAFAAIFLGVFALGWIAGENSAMDKEKKDALARALHMQRIYTGIQETKVHLRSALVYINPALEDIQRVRMDIEMALDRLDKVIND